MASKHPLRRRKRPGGLGKTTCKSVEQADNHKKPPKRLTPVVGQKLNGKSRDKCKTGTCVLIDTGKIRVFVTCEHAWTQWEKYKSKHPAAELLVGLGNGTPFVLSNAE